MCQSSRTVGDRQIVAALIVLHLLLVAFCAVRYSFAATEVGLLPAGIIDWRYGSFDVYRVNPPLVRMWGTIPVVASGGEVPFRGVITDPRSRAEWEVARSMFEADSDAAYRWLVWSRLFCLPFAFVGIWVASRWAWQLYGRAAGVLLPISILARPPRTRVGVLVGDRRRIDHADQEQLADFTRPVARLVARDSAGGIVVAATAWLVTSSLWMYPHSLSYFNESIGGPMRAERYLNASNLDWGQDLLYVRRWQEANPEARPLWVRNWVGLATPEKAGIETQGLVPTLPRDIRRPRGVSSLDSEPRFRPGWYVIDRESQLSRGGE